MTDRHTAYLVTLDKPVREDDAQDTVTALLQIRGVGSVTPVVSDHLAEAAATERRDGEWIAALRRAATEVHGR